jgi:phage tail sheath protein FI
LSDQDYLNGIRVVKGGGDVRVIVTPNQAVVGVVGTAPKADDKLLPVETPTVFFKQKDALGAILPDLTKVTTENEKGTLYLSVRAIFDQRAQTVIVVRAKSESLEDISNAIDKFLDSEALTNYKPKIICAPGHTGNIPVATPVVSLAEITEPALETSAAPSLVKSSRPLVPTASMKVQ